MAGQPWWAAPLGIDIWIWAVVIIVLVLGGIGLAKLYSHLSLLRFERWKRRVMQHTPRHEGDEHDYESWEAPSTFRGAPAASPPERQADYYRQGYSAQYYQPPPYSPSVTGVTERRNSSSSESGGYTAQARQAHDPAPAPQAHSGSAQGAQPQKGLDDIMRRLDDMESRRRGGP